MFAAGAGAHAFLAYHGWATRDLYVTAFTAGMSLMLALLALDYGGML